mgnify:CR=1 FL=1
MSILLLENYIKNIIEEKPISALHVFDFDMTLYDSYKKRWLDKTLSQLKKSFDTPEVRTILCTARSKESSYIIETEKILNQNNMSLLDFDECYFKSVNRKEKVSVYKSNVILDELKSNRLIEIVKFWDDKTDSLMQTKKDIKSYNKDIVYIPVKC